MTITKSGKSVLMAAGAGFGLMHSLRVLANIGTSIGQSAARIQKLDARVDTLDMAVSRLVHQIERLHLDMDQRVTRDEVSEKIDRMLLQLDRGVEERFERQAKSVEALRVMVGQTDELLQKVLDGLETLRGNASADSEPWNLSETRH